MSNRRESDKQKKIKDLIENKEKENKIVTYKDLKGKFGDIRSPLAALLNKEEIRISGFEKNNKFSLDNLYFEMRLPHKSIQDIILLFKRLESKDIAEYKKGSNELIDLFHEKIKEYEHLENIIINDLEKNIARIPLNNLIEYTGIFRDKFKGRGFKSVKEFIKEVEIIIDDDKIKSDKNLTEIGHYLYSHWPRESEVNEWKKEIIENRNAQIIFLKAIYTHPWFNNIPLSGELPLYRLKKRFKPFVDLSGEMKNENYLSKNGVKKSGRTINDSTNLFYDLLFYIERKKSNIIKNALITCLSYPTTEKELIEHLITFDKLLKKVEYIPQNPKKTDLIELDESLNDGYNQEYTDRDFYESIGCDEFGRNKKYLNNKESEELENFLLFLKDSYSNWKNQ